jgi:hypothetical protein
VCKWSRGRKHRKESSEMGTVSKEMKQGRGGQSQPQARGLECGENGEKAGGLGGGAPGCWCRALAAGTMAARSGAGVLRVMRAVCKLILQHLQPTQYDGRCRAKGYERG